MANAELRVTSAGVPAQQSTAATPISPEALQLYVESVVVASATPDTILNYWDDPTDFGLSQVPPVPALEGAGYLSFVVSGTLTVGKYRVEFDVGNIGRVDDGFAGFNVEATADTAAFNGILLPTGAGDNPRGYTSLEFSVSTASVGSAWILSLNWTNAYSVPERHQYRQLAIYGFVIRRLEASLCDVTLNPLTVTPITPADPGQVTPTPGGWVGVFSPAGTISRWTHETQIYPRLDDGVSPLESLVPLSSMLTGSTPDRRQDLYISGFTGNEVAADTAPQDAPIITTLGIETTPISEIVAVDGFTFDVLQYSATWDDTTLTLNHNGDDGDAGGYSEMIINYVQGGFDIATMSVGTYLTVYFNSVEVLTVAEVDVPHDGEGLLIPTNYTFSASDTGLLSFNYYNDSGTPPCQMTITNVVVETRSF